MDIFQQAGSKRKSVSEIKNILGGSFEPIICAILHISQYEKLNNMAKEIVSLSHFNEPKNGWLIIFLQMCGI